MTDLLKIMTTALRKAANPILRDFNELELLLNSYNSAVDYATKTNEHAATTIYKDLARFKNNYSFTVLGVESNGLDTSNRFIVDGIVGLKNFVKAIPYFSLSLYLMRDNQVQACAFYNPITNEMFSAEKGLGAFYNQKRMRFDNTDNPNGLAVIDTGAFASTDIKNYDMLALNNCPALDICYTAANKYSAIAYANQYDVTKLQAALLLAQEAKLALHYSALNNKITSLKIA